MGGAVFGDPALDRMHLGGGGGGLWRTNTPKCGYVSGPGGTGGGIVVVLAGTAAIDGDVFANGAASVGVSPGTRLYGAGGGAGGTVWLTVRNLSLTGLVEATGGAGAIPPPCEAPKAADGSSRS